MASSAASGGAVSSVAHGDVSELMRAVAQGHAEAQRMLAGRLVARVRRAAHAFMPRSIDADDAALHALIEILRSTHTYRGEVSLERWADPVLSHAIVRFARAVRRRNGEGSGEENTLLPDERTPARTLENILRRIPPVRREVLLLRHALGHSIEQIAEVTQASPSMVQERLLGARRELRRAYPGVQPTGNGTSDGERWALLRDRDAVGETLSDKELRELVELERSGVIARVHAAQIEELEALLQLHPGDRAERDRDLVEHALAAVQVTYRPLVEGMSDPDADLAGTVDPEGPRWLRSGALALSVLLAVAALVSLALYEPRPRGPAQRVLGERASQAPRYTVEALTTAHAAKRGGRLHRAGRPLAAGAVLSVGDLVSAPERAACLVIAPSAEVCLAVGSTARIASLALHGSAVEVLRGRIIVTHESDKGGFELRAGDVRASALGTVFGLERSEDGSILRVRVLEGRVQVHSPFGASEAGPLQMAVIRHGSRSNQIESVPEGQVQREWELRATGLPPSAMPSRPARSVAAAERAQQEAEPELAEAEPVSPPPAVSSDVPRRLLEQAWEQLKQRHWNEASKLYDTILREHAASPEAHVVLVRLGGLQLERLGQPEAALVSFERYMREGGGPLQVEAMHGRVDALARLKRTSDERAAIQDFLHMYPSGLKADVLRARLRELSH